MNHKKNHKILMNRQQVQITQKYGSNALQAHGALGETFDKSDFSLHGTVLAKKYAIYYLYVFYCQKSLNLLEMQ